MFVLDFIVFVFEEELFAEDDPEDPLFAVLLFPLERMPVILPRVVLVFLDLVPDEIFGMSLSSEDFVFSEFVILTLGEISDSAIFVGFDRDEFSVGGEPSLRLFNRIFPLFVCSIAG